MAPRWVAGAELAVPPPRAAVRAIGGRQPATAAPAARGDTTAGGGSSAGGSTGSAGAGGNAIGGNATGAGGNAAAGADGAGGAGTGGRGGAGGSSGGTGIGGTGTGSTGMGGAGGDTGGSRDGGADVPPGSAPATGARFSFFYTSLQAMRRLSGSQNGFGGDLRFGAATGIEGADKICQTIASDVGAGNKTWRAFLSATRGPEGQPVHAIERIGEGPWYDRRGRLIANDRAALVTGNRPAGDGQAVADLPDESGQGTRSMGDTHDVITGSNRMGRLADTDPVRTCQDWTSLQGRGVQIGHSWPAGSGMHWIVAHTEPSCAAGVNLVQNGPGNGSSIGAGGGWGGFYCFALQP